MLRTILITIFLLFSLNLVAFSEINFYDLKAKLYHGEEVDFSKYKDKVVLVTNFNLKCGTTYQLGDIEEVYQKYKDKDFRILAFPSENFAKMDQKSGHEINHFCSNKYGVTFPVFETVNVKGDEIHDVFKFLTDSNHEHNSGEIEFNAEKFLIGKDGKLIARYGPFTGIKSRRVTRDIEKALE